jgi:hypothetical protein
MRKSLEIERFFFFEEACDRLNCLGSQLAAGAGVRTSLSASPRNDSRSNFAEIVGGLAPRVRLLTRKFGGMHL